MHSRVLNKCNKGTLLWNTIIMSPQCLWAYVVQQFQYVVSWVQILSYTIWEMTVKNTYQGIYNRLEDVYSLLVCRRHVLVLISEFTK